MKRTPRPEASPSSTASVPPGAVTTLQADYLGEAVRLWNRLLLPGASETPHLTDKRFAAPDWAANPASAFMAEMYLLNARTMLQLADDMQADQKTKARV